MSSKKVPNTREFTEILDLLRRQLGVKTDAAVAKELGLTPQAVSDFKRRGRIPYDKVIKYCVDHQVPLDLVLLGNSGEVEEVIEVKAIGRASDAASTAYDAQVREIVTILEKELPEAKKHIHRILVLRRDLKKAMEEFSRAEDSSEDEAPKEEVEV